jgi:hypothetical protein
MSAGFCAYCDCEIIGSVYLKKFCSEECYESHAVHMDPPDGEVCGECGRQDCGCLWDEPKPRKYFDSGPYDNDF